MDEIIKVSNLSHRDVYSLIKEVQPEEGQYERLDEQTNGEMNEVALSSLILAITPIVISGMATWIASRGKKVRLSIQLSPLSVELAIDPEQISVQEIEKSISDSIKNLQNKM